MLGTIWFQDLKVIWIAVVWRWRIGFIAYQMPGNACLIGDVIAIPPKITWIFGACMLINSECFSE